MVSRLCLLPRAYAFSRRSLSFLPLHLLPSLTFLESDLRLVNSRQVKLQGKEKGIKGHEECVAGLLLLLFLSLVLLAPDAPSPPRVSRCRRRSMRTVMMMTMMRRNSVSRRNRRGTRMPRLLSRRLLFKI